MTTIQPQEEEKKGPEGEKDTSAIPVTILSGFLGGGKTTLLKHILESIQHKLKVAVIVNDMAELNIDSALIQQLQQDSVVQAEREIVSLQNGCICCTLRGDLIREIARIKEMHEFDHVVIESTGIAEPASVAQAFVFDPATEQLARSEKDMLWKQARLDTCVTVIDAHSFPALMASLKQFGESFEDGLDRSTPEGRVEGEKSIATLLMDQVEFANVILINKIDLVSQDERHRVQEILKTLNPTAKLIFTKYCEVDLTEILNTGAFDMSEAQRSPGWLKAIREVQDEEEQLARGEAPRVHSESEEYGVTSFVYRSRIPFHPARIGRWVDSIFHFVNEWKSLGKEKRELSTDKKYEHMQKEYGNILRAKGFCWLAEHDTFMLGLAQSGRIGSIHPIMPWYTIIPKEQWGVQPGTADYDLITNKFAEPHGDRRQELVFIGTDLKVDNITKALDKCLLTKKELKHYKFYSDKGSLGKE